MRSFICSAFTGRDNQSGDIGRVLWAFLTAALVAHQAYAVGVSHQPFDPVQFATASAAILAAGGAALGLKAHTEPGQ